MKNILQKVFTVSIVGALMFLLGRGNGYSDRSMNEIDSGPANGIVK